MVDRKRLPLDKLIDIRIGHRHAEARRAESRDFFYNHKLSQDLSLHRKGMCFAPLLI